MAVFFENRVFVLLQDVAVPVYRLALVMDGGYGLIPYRCLSEIVFHVFAERSYVDGTQVAHHS